MFTRHTEANIHFLFSDIFLLSYVSHLLWRRANARNVSFETLYGGQFTLSTQLIILNYPVIISHWRSITVSLETYPIIHL